MSYDLPGGIIRLSEANNWSQAVREWGLVDIEMRHAGDEPGECLCGKKPIFELCHIANRENGRAAIVGNCCVLKFDDTIEVFGNTKKVFDCAKRLLADDKASANRELIALSKEKGLLSQRDAEFYTDIWRKRNLSDAQATWKARLNTKILYGLVLSAKGAFERLTPTATAGPRLVDYAFSKGVLTERDKRFYLDIWDREHSRLSEKQQNYKCGLNRRMIQQLYCVDANSIDLEVSSESET